MLLLKVYDFGTRIMVRSNSFYKEHQKKKYFCQEGHKNLETEIDLAALRVLNFRELREQKGLLRGLFA